MISVANPIPEPEGFDEKCCKAGEKWLGENPGSDRPKDFWTPFKPALAAGFADLCGFGAMWISSGTVDHFVSWKEDPAKAYEWDNFRYLEGWINSAKSKRPAANFLDPFEVQSGWFEILLPSMQLIFTDALPEALRERAQYTLDKLHLINDERILKTRREWYRMYQTGELTLAGLKKKAPLIAEAVEKQIKLTGNQQWISLASPAKHRL